MSDYKLTVGIECHVQFKTRSKLFSGADNDARTAQANSLINHIDFGLPGALPVLNKEAVLLASRAAFALNTTPQLFSKFDRKHYFYPDLPMGYQITQFDEPIILGGYVEFMVGKELKRINITRAHIEADAGKSVHPDGKDYSLVDLNRAGTPLLEIVSEPEIHSPEIAKAYASELYLLMRYADVSDANLFYGNMRFDVNVSVSKTSELGTRSETKNLNSFKAVEKAVEYEMNRQIKALENGEVIVQETRGWDDSKNQTYSMRTKENADDYRYMPDPDIPPVILTKEYVEAVKNSMPDMPKVWRDKLQKLGIDESISSTLILSEIEFDAHNLEFLTTTFDGSSKQIANLIVNTEIPLRKTLNETKPDITFISDRDRHELYLYLIDISQKGLISSNNIKLLIEELLIIETGLPENLEEYIKDRGMLQNSNSDELEEIVKSVIEQNPKAAEDIRAGELKAIGFLVGNVMKLSNGQANPSVVNELIKKVIGI